ncbi:MAG: hypothetical protein R6U96_17695 [Promethearchaeia archaeon]
MKKRLDHPVDFGIRKIVPGIFVCFTRCDVLPKHEPEKNKVLRKRISKIKEVFKAQQRTILEVFSTYTGDNQETQMHNSRFFFTLSKLIAEN